MRLKIIAILVAVALWPAFALAQDADDNPEVRGTAVVSSDEPTIEQSTIEVDNPDSKVPDQLTAMSALQMWQLIAAGIATGLTGLALRWVPMPRAKDKREDVRKAVAFGVAVIVAVIGAGLNGDLDSWQPSVAGLGYIAIISWFAYEKIPLVKPAAHAVEGRAKPT